VAAIALSLLALLVAGAASAQAGPGVTLRQGSTSVPVSITGDQISGNADASGTYTLRDKPGSAGTKITLHGLSIRGLLSLAGFNPGAVRFVQVVGADGSVISLTGPQINSPPFPEGPAIVADDGTTTRFVRPIRFAGDTSDDVASVPGTPLEMTVDGGSLLSIRASASPSTAKTGQTITFRASVRFPPPGAQFTYAWDFDDGTHGIGAQATHKYSSSGDFTPRVTVHGSGGSTALCASVCEGTETADVTITGATRRPDQAQGTPSGTGSANGVGGTGNGGTGNGPGSGTGGSGDLTAFGGEPAKPQRKAPPPRHVRPQPHTRFSSNPASGEGKTIVQGILLADIGPAVASALPKGAAAGSPKPRQGVPGTARHTSQLAASIALALAIVTLGALRERQRVRLRVA
jgi:hypothetical protein